MKKIEEMMELLTDELANFDRSVEKLEQLSKNLNRTTVKADSSQIDYRIKEFLKNQEEAVNFYEERFNGMETKLHRAQVVPKWLMTIYGVGLLLPLFAIAYFGYHGFQFQKSKETAFDQGQDHIIRHFNRYFDENPRAYEPYENWKKEDSVILIDQ